MFDIWSFQSFYFVQLLLESCWRWGRYAQIVNNGLRAFHPEFQIKVPQYTVTHYIVLMTTETTEQHGNFNLLHFQYNWMFPLNMTIKTKDCLVNSPSVWTLSFDRPIFWALNTSSKEAASRLNKDQICKMLLLHVQKISLWKKILTNQTSPI